MTARRAGAIAIAVVLSIALGITTNVVSSRPTLPWIVGLVALGVLSVAATLLVDVTATRTDGVSMTNVNGPNTAVKGDNVNVKIGR